MPLTYEEWNEPRVDQVLLNEGHAFLRKKKHRTASSFFCISPFAFHFRVRPSLFKIPREDDRVYIRRWKWSLVSPFNGIIFFNE